jgi:hypothetical protein
MQIDITSLRVHQCLDCNRTQYRVTDIRSDCCWIQERRQAVSEKLDENIAVVLGVNRSIFGICTNLWMSCKLLSRRKCARKDEEEVRWVPHLWLNSGDCAETVRVWSVFKGRVSNEHSSRYSLVSGATGWIEPTEPVRAKHTHSTTELREPLRLRKPSSQTLHVSAPIEAILSIKRHSSQYSTLLYHVDTEWGI